jgi:hypothetical protein
MANFESHESQRLVFTISAPVPDGGAADSGHRDGGATDAAPDGAPHDAAHGG